MTVKADSPDILKKIVEVKNREVVRLKDEAPLPDLLAMIETRAAPLDFAAALVGARVKIIAEVKRASPSRGVLRENLDPARLAAEYADNGAAAVSVLTNADHFHGSLDDMERAGAEAHPRGLPILRKEFIYDPYQVYEARAHGADAILLIVAMLSPDRLSSLKALSERLGMKCLVEVHDEGELEIAVDAGAEIIGVNNRDLRTFRTELEVTDRLAPQAPPDCVLVSESGMKTPADIARARDAGASAVLIGDALVTARNPGALLRELA